MPRQRVEEGRLARGRVCTSAGHRFGTRRRRIPYGGCWCRAACRWARWAGAPPGRWRSGGIELVLPEAGRPLALPSGVCGSCLTQGACCPWMTGMHRLFLETAGVANRWQSPARIGPGRGGGEAAFASVPSMDPAWHGHAIPSRSPPMPTHIRCKSLVGKHVVQQVVIVVLPASLRPGAVAGMHPKGTGSRQQGRGSVAFDANKGL